MFLALLAAMISIGSDDRSQQIEFLRVSYKANTEAFAFGTFHFEYTTGSCATLADAESAVFSKAVREDGLYVFDGKNARYDLIAGPADIAAVTTRIDDQKTASSASSFRMLTDGEVTFLDFQYLDKSNTILNHKPEMYSGTRVFYDDARFKFPLWIGDAGRHPYDLFRGLTAVKEGRASLVELDFDSHLDGLKVCKLSLAYGEDKRTYWVDLSRGCVPLRIVGHHGQNTADSVYKFSDLEHVPNAGWLPRRSLHILLNGKVVDRIVVTQIDTENKPRSPLFQLDFPQPMPVLDRHRKLFYARQKSWSLLNLPSRSSPGTRAAIPRAFNPPTDMPGEIEAGSPWAIVVSAAAVLGIISGAVLIALKRRKRLVGT